MNVTFFYPNSLVAGVFRISNIFWITEMLMKQPFNLFMNILKSGAQICEGFDFRIMEGLLYHLNI